MAKAPNERHLEDWIISHGVNWHEFTEGEPYSQFTKLSRQITLPSGIPDIICLSNNVDICVIEIKKDWIDSQALAQLLRYIRDVKWIVQYTLAQFRDPDPRIKHLEPRVIGNLIGYKVKDKNLAIAADVADITLTEYEYDLDEDHYDFEDFEKEHVKPEVFYQYSKGQIGMYVAEAFQTSIHQNERVDIPLSLLTEPSMLASFLVKKIEGKI